MIPIVHDDREVEKLLVNLKRQVVELGGWIHPETQICCEDGNLSVRANGGLPANEPLITVPEPALLPVDDVEFAVTQDDLHLASPPTHLSAERRRLLDTMLEIYSRTRKITAHRTVSPWLAFANEPDILEALVKGRATAPRVKGYYKDYLAGKNASLICNSFINARVLGFKASHGQAMVLMPILDFFNHHPSAPGFQPHADQSGNHLLTVLKANPIAASAECFVRYGHYDALDTYLLYGFVYDLAAFIRSVPVQINLHDVGMIEVRATIGVQVAPGKLPPHPPSLRPFMPVIGKAASNHLIASHLLIPAGAPLAFAMRRVLQELVRLLRPGLDQAALDRHVAEAEKIVVSTNIRFYDGLLDLLDSRVGGPHDTHAIATARHLAEIQLAKLRAYGDALAKPRGHLPPAHR